MENSLLFWYPKIKDLSIPMPKTHIIELQLDYKDLCAICDGNYISLDKYKDDLDRYSMELGYPLFLRTDQSSAKHEWISTCYVENADNLFPNISSLIESDLLSMVRESPKALVFREFIPMESLFTAFDGHTPINPERRYFIKDDSVICHHPYWIEESIQNWISGPDKQTYEGILEPSESLERLTELEPQKKPSVENWQGILKKINAEMPEEIALLTGYSQQVASKFDGYWSVDYCKARSGKWVLIDMAKGEDSWHPEDCKNH